MVCWVISLITDFNPRSPDGERREVATPCCSISYFNPRSPDGERRYDAMYHPAQWRFQSTLPGWGATTMEFRTPLAGLISIHAPRMGSDPLFRLPQPRCTHFNPRSPDGERPAVRRSTSFDRYFNPRSPDGERLVRSCCSVCSTVFQSTLPGWGATAKMDIFAHDMGKIIHFQH